MEKKFEDITRIDDRQTFAEANAYVDALIDEATANGSLDEQETENEYTREIGRVGCMCADYESKYIKFEHLKFK